MMTLQISTKPNPAVLLKRFGLGPKPYAMDRVAADPIAALRHELNNPAIALINDPTLPGYAAACALSQTSVAAAEQHSMVELIARVNKALQPEVGFLERLVMFWSNHFSVSRTKAGVVAGTVGQLERDVIRRNVLGKFSDMLLGVYRHPAMVAFLDCENSAGPNSPYGIQNRLTYNENLARELLELHTVGIRSGYTQADVIAASKILTGWSYVRRWEAEQQVNGGNAGNIGQFIFRSAWHEPGVHTVLGQAFSRTGQAQGEDLLLMLANHPATAHKIATKLISHFIAEEPSEADVSYVAAAFLNSGGNLKETAEALLSLPGAFSPEQQKFMLPYDMLVAYKRFFGVSTIAAGREWLFIEPLRNMYHLTWSYRTPDGYPDTIDRWNNPDSLSIRLDVSSYYASGYWSAVPTDVAEYARRAFGPVMSQATYDAVRRAPSRKDAIVVSLMSPEFQKR